MKNIRIGIVAPKRSFIDRPWVKQDFDILRELGFDVIFIESERLLRNLKKIITCHLLFEWFAYYDAAFCARIFGRRSILNAVGHEVVYYPDFKYGLVKPYIRSFVALGLKCADKVVAVSKESARWAEFWGKRKVQVIYEGIDTSKFKSFNMSKYENEKIVLAVANLEKNIVIRKNLFTLIHAMKPVVEKMDNARLIIVGKKMDGYPSLQLLVEKLKLERNVNFAGRVTDEELVCFYNMCDVFVMPSLHEGFPTVCCEALSCEKPVITSNRPSMNEIFTPNSQVILVNPLDHTEIAEAIIKVLEDVELARHLGGIGREFVVRNFSHTARKERLHNIINETLKERKRIGGIDLPFLFFYLMSKVSLVVFNVAFRVLSSAKGD
jgi:glycosyltransferase involved in cell wall biosynthesis